MLQGDFADWLREGTTAGILTWNGKVIDVEVPNTVTLKVVETSMGEKGDTKGSGAAPQPVSSTDNGGKPAVAGFQQRHDGAGGNKPATMETGAVVTVPLFIGIGDEIIVDTRNRTYLNRAGGPSF